MFAGDVTSHQLHNLKPGTTYDLKVLAQYEMGLSAPLIGQGTTCKLPTQKQHSLTGLTAQNEIDDCSLKCQSIVLQTSVVVKDYELRRMLLSSVPERDRPDHLQRWL